MCDVVEISRFLIHVIQSLGNPRALITSSRYSQDMESNALEKSILKKIDGMWVLLRYVSSSRAERKVCISCLPLINVVWFWCIRFGRKGCSLVARILVIIFGNAESTLIGRKSDIVCVSGFFVTRVMYAWLIR
jgi:hypothetical protein